MNRPSEQLGPFLYEPGENCFPLGQDSLLLGSFATVRAGWRVCDLGCGDGALPLLLAGRAERLNLAGVELDPGAAAAAERNLHRAGLNGQILCGDVREIRVLLPAGSCDLVVANPPYFAAGRGTPGSCARTETCGTLEQWCAAAAYLTRNGGRFALVHRPERLAELFRCLDRSGLEPKRLQLVQHRPDCGPSAVLLETVRRGKPGLEILPTIMTGGC